MGELDLMQTLVVDMKGIIYVYFGHTRTNSVLVMIQVSGKHASHQKRIFSLRMFFQFVPVISQKHLEVQQALHLSGTYETGEHDECEKQPENGLLLWQHSTKTTKL